MVNLHPDSYISPFSDKSPAVSLGYITTIAIKTKALENEMKSDECLHLDMSDARKFSIPTFSVFLHST